MAEHLAKTCKLEEKKFTADAPLDSLVIGIVNISRLFTDLYLLLIYPSFKGLPKIHSTLLALLKPSNRAKQEMCLNFYFPLSNDLFLVGKGFVTNA